MQEWKLFGVETLMLYMNIVMLYDGERRELLFAVRIVKRLHHFPLHPPPHTHTQTIEIRKYYDVTQSGKLFWPCSRQYNNALPWILQDAMNKCKKDLNPTFRFQIIWYNRCKDS